MSRFAVRRRMGVEVTGQREAARPAVAPEREVAAHVAVAEALVSWDGLERGAERLLASLAAALDFRAGVLWVPSGERLRPRVFWHQDGVDVREFKLMTLTSRLRRGMEVPGQAWQLLEPSARGSAAGPLPPRLRAALAAGLLGALALPAVWAREVIAVVELDGEREPQLGEPFKRSLTAIGYVLGGFLAHRRGELEKRVITDRQVEVLQLAAQGLSSEEIAERLVVSRATVKTHFEHIYARLGVANRVAAVAKAMRLGLVS
jgi:DNA-binding CsgD family transcriptional regulator